MDSAAFLLERVAVFQILDKCSYKLCSALPFLH